MFPAIREAVQELRKGFGSDLIRLDLKATESTFGITPEYAKELRLRGLVGAQSWSGEAVNEATALNHSVVWACTRIISEVEAMLPLSLMQKRSEGRFPMTDHPLYRVLHDEPNEQMSAMEFRETMTAHCVLRGNAYARIVRRPGTNEVIALYPLNGKVTPGVSNGALYYEVAQESGLVERFIVRKDQPHDILHIRGLGNDGIKGYGVIEQARHSIGTANSAEKYAAQFYANGGRTPHVIEWDRKFKSKEDGDKWAADWREQYESKDSFHRTPIMEPGMVYKNIGLSPEDSQFLETRQFEVPELCRWFLMTPHMVGDLTRATYSNIEHLFIEFMTRTEMAWLIRWEQAIARCLLTPAEKKSGMYAKHNINAMLRGDFKTRMDGYSIALQNGKNSIDEVRELEDENPLLNGAGRAHHIQLNMQTVPGTGEPTASEKATLAKISQGGGDGKTEPTA